MGALLEHLVRVNAANDLDNEGVGGLNVRDIEIVALSVPTPLGDILNNKLRFPRDEVMQINADAL